MEVAGWSVWRGDSQEDRQRGQGGPVTRGDKRVPGSPSVSHKHPCSNKSGIIDI